MEETTENISRVKMENLDQNTLKITEKIKHADTTQPSEKLNFQNMNGINLCATSDLVDRIKKEEIPIEEWDQCDMIDSDDIMMMKCDQEAAVKVERLEIHEDMDTLDPTTGILIPKSSDNISRDDVVVDRIKSEDIKTEKLRGSDFPTNFMEDKKLQKEETEEMLPGGYSAETYPLQLTEELDIKIETGTSSDVALESATKKTTADQTSFSCYNCKYTTCHKIDSKCHMESHASSLECDPPGLVESYHNMYKCTKCNKSLKTKGGLNEHILKKYPEFTSTVTGKIRGCLECGFKTVKGGAYLDNHIISKHPDSTGSTSSQIRVCSKCSFRTASCERILDDHIIRKHEDLVSFVTSSIYECKHCPYRTTIMNKFSKHKPKHHETLKYLKCGSCNKEYKTKTGLNYHIVKKHPNLAAAITSKLLECEMCPFKTNRSKVALDDHIIVKHPGFIGAITSKVYECTHCLFKTTIKPRLSRHMLVHPSQ